MFHVYTVNPLPPSGTGATASGLLQATAADYSRKVGTGDRSPLSAFVRYLYNPDWAMTLRYQVETYNQNDFRTQNPSYVAPGVLSPQIGNYYFEGNSYQNYHRVSQLMLEAGALPFARGKVDAVARNALPPVASLRGAVTATRGSTGKPCLPARVDDSHCTAGRDRHHLIERLQPAVPGAQVVRAGRDTLEVKQSVLVRHREVRRRDDDDVANHLRVNVTEEDHVGSLVGKIEAAPLTLQYVPIRLRHSRTGERRCASPGHCLEMRPSTPA